MDNTIKRLDLYENYVHPLVNDMLSKGYGLTLYGIRQRDMDSPYTILDKGIWTHPIRY